MLWLMIWSGINVRVIVYCWLLTIVVVSCVSSLIPTKPPIITFVSPVEVTTIDYPTPSRGSVTNTTTETTDDYDKGYQQGYTDKEDE